MLGDDTRAHPGDENAQDDARSQLGSDLSQPFGSHAFGSICGQQVWCDREEPQQRRSEHEKRKALCERHDRQRYRLSGGKRDGEAAVGKPVAQRQQQEDPDGQSELVERRDQSDPCVADPEVVGNQRDDRMDIIGVRRHHRRGDRERGFLRGRQSCRMVQPR